MKAIKCPRCEINFMREGEPCCAICKRELKGMADKEEEMELCSECGEHTVVPGEELCSSCLKEHALMDDDASKLPILKVKAESNEDDDVDDSDGDSLPIDEIDIPLVGDGIPTTEMEEIDIDLGLDDDDLDDGLGEEEEDQELITLDSVENLDEFDDDDPDLDEEDVFQYSGNFGKKVNRPQL